MHIGILSFQTKHFENYTSVDEIAERVVKNGHKVTIINVSDLELTFTNKTIFSLKSKELPIFDAIIVRPRIIADPSIPSTYMNALASQGQLLINGSATVRATKNKLETLRLLSEANVAIPKTCTIKSLENIEQIMKGFNFPVIIKTLYGSSGVGVFYAESMKALRPIVSFQLNRGQFNDPISIQEFIAEAKTTDIRAFVVGDKIVAAMKRTAPNGDVRANYSGGGTIEKYTLSAEEENIALKATRATHADYAGVDILQTDNGPVVIEVNSNPGFKGIKEATGVDVADEIVKYTLLKAAK